MFKTEPLFSSAATPGTGKNLLADDGEGETQEQPGLIQQIVSFFSKLWSPGTSDAEKLGWSYVYAEDGSLLGEYGSGGSASSGTSQYLYLPTAAGPMPIAAVIKGQTYAVHSDHLNTPRKLTQADGQVAWQWAYSAFGEEQPSTGAKRFTSETTTPTTGATSVPEVTFNLRYPGQYFDSETKLHYNHFRSYDGRTGRYTQGDPIGLDGGWNRFSYVGGNPLSLIDPRGLAVAWTGSLMNFGATSGVGGQVARFEFESECKCGRKFRIKGFASFISIGAGASLKGVGKFLGEASGTSGSMTLTDPSSDCPDPYAANGPAWQSGINLVLGVGGTIFPAWHLGKLKTTGLADGPSYGFDISLTSTFYGHSTVTSVEEIKCDDCER